MNNKKKKITVTFTSVIAFFIIMALVYALVTGLIDILGKLKTGNVKIETLDLSFKKQNGADVDVLEPADVNTISWTTKNIGTSGIYTRHTLEIMWNDATEIDTSNLLYLYPANVARKEIIADYEKGEDSPYLIHTEKITKVEGGRTRYGIKYQFLGDTLDGTKMQNVSEELNYNYGDFDIPDDGSVNVDDVIDTTTDDDSTTEDKIAFRLLLSPKTSYLLQNRSVTIKVVTEAMQYTKNGETAWQVVDSQQI